MPGRQHTSCRKQEAVSEAQDFGIWGLTARFLTIHPSRIFWLTCFVLGQLMFPCPLLVPTFEGLTASLLFIKAVRHQSGTGMPCLHVLVDNTGKHLSVVLPAPCSP